MIITGKRMKRGAGKENPNLTMGSEGSKKKVRAFQNFNIECPLDHQVAISSMKNNKSLFYMILNRFRNETLVNALNQITEAIDTD